MINWYLQSENESDVIISSRIRLARNLKDIPFKVKQSNEDAKKLLEKIKEITPSIGYGLKFLNLKDIDDITKMSLIEKHLISPDIVLKDKQNSAILINEDENICIMINEEDHLRIQVFSSGFNLQSILQLSTEIDEKIDSLLNYACNKEFGYLTSCPTNVGTGLRASVMVHLPALRITGNLSKVLRIVNSFGMTIRGVYGEDSKATGDIYQISNNQTLGVDEKEIISNIENITRKVIEQERIARKYIAKNTIEIEDKVYRDFGILTNARKITSEECNNLLSNIKLGVDLGIINQLDDIKVKKIYLYTKPANLQKYKGEILNEYERDIKRAEVIKQIISNKEV